MSQSANKVGVLSTLPSIFSQMHESKVKSGKSFEQISKEIGRSEMYTAAM